MTARILLDWGGIFLLNTKRRKGYCLLTYTKQGLKTVLRHNGNKPASVPIVLGPVKYMIAKFFWLFNHVNAESLRN